MTEHDNLATARRYLQALEAGEPQRAADCFAADIDQVEFPNRLKPKGDRRGAEALRADGRAGLKLLSRQSYDIRHSLAVGDDVVLEVYWEGELAAPVAGLAAGDVMTAHSAIMLTFRDGRIVRQRNYDCFPPLGEVSPFADLEFGH